MFSLDMKTGGDKYNMLHFISPNFMIMIKFIFSINFRLMSVIIAFIKVNDVAGMSIHTLTIFKVEEYSYFNCMCM